MGGALPVSQQHVIPCLIFSRSDPRRRISEEHDRMDRKYKTEPSKKDVLVAMRHSVREKPVKCHRFLPGPQNSEGVPKD